MESISLDGQIAVKTGFTLKDHIWKAGSYFIDELNILLTPDKKCSLLLEKDHFDGAAYSIDDFFERVKHCFDNPELFYKIFQPPSEECVQQLHRKNGFTLYSFPSPVQTPWHENNTAYYRFFGNSSSDTILLVVPGWARPDLSAEEGMCKQFLKNDIDCCLVTKPFHQERKVPGTFSGELFISGNIFLTVMNFRQQVAELRFLINRFRQTYKYIGVIGISSGGFQGALACDVEEIDFYFPIITGAKLGSIAWQGKLTKFVKQDIARKGVSEEQLNKAWAIADQLYLGKHCKAKHIKQFISLYDPIVPTQYQVLLWHIYNRPDVFEMRCGHISTFFYFNRIVREITNFIRERKTK